MKRLTVLFGTICVLMIAMFAVSAAQKGANFAGTWELDKPKSELPQRMQNIDGMTWTVTQDDKQLTREQKIDRAGGPPAGGPPAGGPPAGGPPAGGPPAGGPPPGGGRGMGMMGGGRPITLNLDGSETVSENPRGKSTSKVKWLDGGKILEVNTVSNFSTPNGDVTVTSVEHWELADGGKTLKVHQSVETPMGQTESKLVFNKK